MTFKVPTVTLSDGNVMPLIGYGTSSVVGIGKPGDPAYDAIVTAVKLGYRFIDTASLYGNEETVGSAINDLIRDKIVAREDLFICTKVWNTAHKRASVMKACKKSLNRLGLEYIDLYLIHWPTAYVEDGDPINPRDSVTNRTLYSDTHFLETWLGMQDVKDAGLARSIGLSNFNHIQCDEILAMRGLKHKPVVNQVECHPYLNQEKLRNYGRKNGIVLIAYCPLGAPGAQWVSSGGKSCKKTATEAPPKLLDDYKFKELSVKYNKTPAQIILRFQVQRHVSVIPKSVTVERMKQNIDLSGFELDESDMQELMNIDRGLRYCLNTAGEYIDDHPLYPFHEF